MDDAKEPSRKPQPGPVLRQELAKAATTHPLEELQGRGIQRVRLISESRLQELMEVALKRAIEISLGDPALPESLRHLLQERSRQEFWELVQGKAEPPGKPQAANGPAEETAIPAVVLDDESTEPPEPTPALDARMIRDLTALIEKDWRAELKEVKDSQRQQLQFLEARISKLVQAIGSTERALACLQETDSPRAPALRTTGADPGIDPHHPLYGKKSELLLALFEANLELRELERSET
ncbi:MAG: hypothetical protein V3T77_03340 [Planctomycetota bacterium]